MSGAVFTCFDLLCYSSCSTVAVLTRWIVREESRILGVFGTEIIETDANGQAQPGVPRPRLPPFASGYEDR